MTDTSLTPSFLDAILDKILGILPSDGDEPPWPENGKSYPVHFEVEYIGKHWEDMPRINVTDCPEDLRHILAEHNLIDMIDNDELPIASGVYSAMLTYVYDSCIDWETGADDGDFGFTVSNLIHLSQFTNDFYEGHAK